MISILEKYALGGLLAALIALGGYTAWLKIDNMSLALTVAEQNTEISKKDSTIQELGMNAKATDDLVQDFKASLQTLKEKELERQKAVEEALAQANITAKAFESYSGKLLASTPKSSNICTEADDLINSYLDHERAGK